MFPAKGSTVGCSATFGATVTHDGADAIAPCVQLKDARKDTSPCYALGLVTAATTGRGEEELWELTLDGLADGGAGETWEFRIRVNDAAGGKKLAQTNWKDFRIACGGGGGGAPSPSRPAADRGPPTGPTGTPVADADWPDTGGELLPSRRVARASAPSVRCSPPPSPPLPPLRPSLDAAPQRGTAGRRGGRDVHGAPHVPPG